MPKRKSESDKSILVKSKTIFKEENTKAEEFLTIANNLNNELEKISFIKNIKYVYNPTRYAYLSYESYIEKYCNSSKKVMYLGMNPGPWGMSQTGVPFGEVDTVKNWLKIEETVQKPENELSTRPILGFACKKSEISGKRFWGLMKEICVEPEVFFNHCFVYNYLPLQFMNESGKNLPPTVLKSNEQEILYKSCDVALVNVIKLYDVKIIVAIGKFTESRAQSALKNSPSKQDIKVVSILHPSPQSKAANNWQIDAHKQLQDLGLLEYFNK